MLSKAFSINGKGKMRKGVVWFARRSKNKKLLQLPLRKPIASTYPIE